MKRAILFVYVILAFFALFSCDEVQQQEKQKLQQKASQQPAKPAPEDSLTKTYDGLQITIIGVERTKEWVMFPSAGQSSPRLKAKAGQEIVVFHLEVKDSATNKESDKSFSEFVLFDVKGNKYNSEMVGGDVRDIPFGVPEGAQLKTFQVEKLSFNVEKLTPDKPQENVKGRAEEEKVVQEKTEQKKMIQALYPNISNGTHNLQVVKVEKRPTMHGGMLKPRNPDDVFLIVYIKTDDPSFDSDKASLDEIAGACGTLQTASGKTYNADGGGMIDGKQACSFIVPKNTYSVTLRLKGYPDLKLDVK